MDHNRANAQEVRPVEAKAKNMISHAVNTNRTFSLLVLLVAAVEKGINISSDTLEGRRDPNSS